MILMRRDYVPPYPAACGVYKAMQLLRQAHQNSTLAASPRNSPDHGQDDCCYTLWNRRGDSVAGQPSFCRELQRTGYNAADGMGMSTLVD